MATVHDIEVGNCEACPQVEHCLQSVSEIANFGESLVDMAFDPEAEAHADDFLALLQDSGFMDVIEQVTGEVPHDGQSLIKMTRRQVAAQLEHLDGHKDEAKARISEFTADCGGPLKMRAHKAGQVITATVCISPLQPEGFSCEGTHVDRRRDNGSV